MLYLKSITIDKFKSFSHASLLFSNGFTCVVGPNGSGKSTICDALLFGLGETAARRLRVERYDQLIRGVSEQQKQLKIANVKLEFTGDTNLSVMRFVRSDGKTAYKLNGKHMKKHEVMSTLLKYGMKADETNTISQGEIITLGNMKPLELRELIDTASGIKDFENKKNEAIRELEKVDQKIGESNIELSTHKGFLEELETDKTAAEKYLESASRLKVLNYSILLLKKRNAEKFLIDFNKSIGDVETKNAFASKKLTETNEKINLSVQERQKLTKQLSESNQETGSINSRLEAVNIQIVRTEAEQESLSNSIKELELSIKALTEEKIAANSNIDSNSKSISSTQHKLRPIDEQLSKIKLKPEELKSNPDLIKNLKNEEFELEKKLDTISLELSNINSELSATKAFKDGKEQEYGYALKLLDDKKKELASLNDKLTKITISITEFLKNDKKLESELRLLDNLGLEIDEKLILLREQRASIQQRNQSGYERIKTKFNKDNGFFGKASELCSYDLKSAYAIEASAGSRLEYFIVDTMSTANEIIKYMRENSLGRATFIPLLEIRSNEDIHSEKGMTPVIELVKFDQKFSKAFSYIFSNTYLINDINDSKKFGVGKRRYVTIEGDLVEQSGVVSGGSNSKRISSASIDNQMKLLNEEKIKLRDKLDVLSNEIKNIRKSEAFAEMEQKSLKENILTLSQQISTQTDLLKGIKSAIESFEKKITVEELKFKKQISEQESLQKKLLEKREKINLAYSETVELTKRIAESGINEEEIAKIETMRAEAERLKMNIVSLEKENELLKKRIIVIEKDISSKSKSIDSIAKNISISETKSASLISERKELEKKIASGSDESKKVYAQLTALDQKINSLGIEKGKLTMEVSSLERQISEIKIRKSQYETTFADISAELSTYREKIDAIEVSIFLMLFSFTVIIRPL